MSALEEELASWTTEVFLECITIDHPDFVGAPHRLVNDKVDLVRTAGTFTAFPFNMRLHTRAEERIALAEITIDNVDQRIIEELRAVGDGGSLMYEVVLRSTPNVVDMGPFTFEIKSLIADLYTLQVQISFAMDFLNEAFPKDYFAPWNAL